MTMTEFAIHSDQLFQLLTAKFRMLLMIYVLKYRKYIHKMIAFQFFIPNLKVKTFYWWTIEINLCATFNAEPHTITHPRLNFMDYWQGGSTVVSGRWSVDTTTWLVPSLDWLTLWMTDFYDTFRRRPREWILPSQQTPLQGIWFSSTHDWQC